MYVYEGVNRMGNPTMTRSKGKINVVFNHTKEDVRVSGTKPVPLLKNMEQEKHPILYRLEKELEKLVGLEKVKLLLKEIYAWLYVNNIRKENGLKSERQTLHMIFKGNPGTGKTTVARLMAQFFREMNVLSKGHFLEIERADLVGEYIGHTAQKTREVMKKATGGVLFIDEAYSLARGGEKDFGKEAIDTLVKGMEDKKEDIVIILAGYSQEMDYFLSLNPGLPSRFPLTIEFPDYSPNELMQIAQRMFHEREYRLSSDADMKLRQYLEENNGRFCYPFSNGRFIRNLVEEAIRNQAVRLLKLDQFDRKSLTTIIASDFPFMKKN